MGDPVERIIENALVAAGIQYHRDGDGQGMTSNLDFRIAGTEVHIECKRFHSPRISEQTSRVGNVIVVQGLAAAEWIADRIRNSNKN